MVAAGVGAAAAPFQTTGDATAPPTTVAA